MKISEAKQVARDWIADYFPTVPNCIGAVLAGSVNFRSDDADYPAASDIDLFFYQSGQPTPRPPKFHHKGVTIEAAHHSSDELENAERILAHPHIALHIARGNILIDPQGILRRLQESIAPEYPKLNWVQRRMGWASGNATGKFNRCVAATGDSLVGPLCVYMLGFRNVAAMAPIAALDNPTMRRCLCVQQEIFAKNGILDLHERLLDLIGVRHLKREDIQPHVAPLSPLFRRACAVVRTPFWARFELDPTAESLFLAGTQEMIDDGHHREAMLFILFVHYFCHQAIQTDGTDTDKRASRDLLHGTLLATGVGSLKDMQDRARAALALLPEFERTTTEIARASSTGIQ